MAVTKKRISLYAIAGVAAAVIILASVLTSGVQFPGTAGGNGNLAMGTLFVRLKDAPADLQSLFVTLNALYVHDDKTDSWIELNFIDAESVVHFDLLTLQDVTLDLSEIELPAGDYSKIRMDVLEASAIFTGEEDETALRVPPGHLDVIVQFKIEEGQTTNVLIDMQVDKISISQSHNLKPVLKATVEPVSTPTVETTTTPTTSPI